MLIDENKLLMFAKLLLFDSWSTEGASVVEVFGFPSFSFNFFPMFSFRALEVYWITTSYSIPVTLEQASNLKANGITHIFVVL